MSKAQKKSPAWEQLVQGGWVATRADAERWILSGKVYSGSTPIRSAGQALPADAPLFVRDMDRKYIAKGGYKLEGALDAFGLDVTGRVAIDAGASTGGFTDCLVQRGCAKVYAVDVGFGQLHGSLRQHPAVVNLERTNIGDDALLALDPTPTLGSVDLSYLSLIKAVPAFARVLKGHGDLLCLVKPLFEIDDSAARREGVIEGDAYAPLLRGLCDALARDDVCVRGVTHSPVTGNSGTVEFFLWLQLGEGMPLDIFARDAQIDAAVAAGLALEKYKK